MIRFFGGKSAGKRGRGASNKSKVVVAVENRGKHAGYATMQIVDHIDSNNINEFIHRSIEPYQTIKTDAYPYCLSEHSTIHFFGANFISV